MFADVNRVSRYLNRLSANTALAIRAHPPVNCTKRANVVHSKEVVSSTPTDTGRDPPPCSNLKDTGDTPVAPRDE